MKMAKKWLDIEIDGRRLTRISKFLETLIKKENDVEKIIKLTNSLTYVTSKKLELAYKVLKINEILEQVERKNKTTGFQ